MQSFNISKFWNDEYLTLAYENVEFNDSDSIEKWRAIGFDGKITGNMCDMNNPQPSWNHKFIDIFQSLGWKHIGTSYYQMKPGTVLPTHADLYKQYISKFKLADRKETIHRAIVFLEDWKSGHYFELGSSPVVQWKAGDVYIWRYDKTHMAANIGFEDRYTLQITGHI